MRLLMLLLLTAATDVRTPPASPPSNTAPSRVPPRVPPTETRPVVPRPDADAPLSWETRISRDDLALLEVYRGFSEDGTSYAYAETLPGSGTPVLIIKSTSGARLARRVLATREDRKEAARLLVREGFPSPGETTPVPDSIGVRRTEDGFVVTVAGAAVGPAYELLADGSDARVLQSEVVAISPETEWVAVRHLVRSADGEPRMPEHQLLPFLAPAPRVPPAGP